MTSHGLSGGSEGSGAETASESADGLATADAEDQCRTSRAREQEFHEGNREPRGIALRKAKRKAKLKMAYAQWVLVPLEYQIWYGSNLQAERDQSAHR